MNRRTEEDYVSERLLDGLTVMEELLNAPSRGYSIRDLASKTGIAYDKVRRALCTLKVKGYARKFLGAWKPGDKCRLFAARIEMAHLRDQTDVIELAEALRSY